MTTHPWRQEILEGVSVLPKICTPGTMVVLGDSAEPILTGTTCKDVLVAAAEHGRGRIVAISHDGYADWFLKPHDSAVVQRFKQNILKWLMHGQYPQNSSFLDIEKCDIKDVPSSEKTIMIWNPSNNMGGDFVDRVKGHVAGGVPLIVTMNPWGHVQTSKCKLEELEPYQLLCDVGIHFTGEVIALHQDGADASRNQAHNAHIGRLVKNCLNGEMQISELLQDHLSAIKSLADDATCGLLGPFAVAEPFPCRPPSKSNPLKSEEDRAAANFMNLVMLKVPIVAPGVHEFPGDFETQPPLSCIDTEVIAYCSEAHPVGAYLQPGGTMTVQVLEGDSDKWEIQIGCHTDKLSDKKEMKRWPNIAFWKPLLKNAPTEVHSSFGGLVYLYSPSGTNKLKVRFENVVLSPLFNIKDKEIIDKWDEIRTYPGLWADFVGNHIQITLPSEVVRDIEKPGPILDFWDSVVSMHNELKGRDVTNKKREWIVPDMQPSVGYMHSGYPVVTQLDATDPKTNMFLMRRPSSAKDQDHWGYFHELGHNMKDSRWTFDGTGEVMCNIFSLHAMYKLFGIQPWENPWLQKQKNSMKKYLKSGADFKEWTSNPGVALGIYAQLAQKFGFDAYKTVFRRYDEENPELPNNTAKIEYWVKTFSRVVKRNLVPAFQLWGFPLSDKVNEELKEFESFRPFDEVTEVADTCEPVKQCTK